LTIAVWFPPAVLERHLGSVVHTRKRHLDLSTVGRMEAAASPLEDQAMPGLPHQDRSDLDDLTPGNSSSTRPRPPPSGSKRTLPGTVDEMRNRGSRRHHSLVSHVKTSNDSAGSVATIVDTRTCGVLVIGGPPSSDSAPGAPGALGMRLESFELRLRYLIGQQAKSVARLRRFLPARLYREGVRRNFSLDS
jgi:hypothetical protein